MGKNVLDYDSPASIRAFLEDNKLAMSRRFGQNFLVDRRMRERIIQALDVETGMRVWEIGPGLGAMTELILEKGALLTAFEIDYGFARLLESLFSGYDDFSIVEGDMRKTWRTQTAQPDRIFGNLPYNVAFDIITDLLKGGCVPPRMVFTLQKEAARRMTARPGSKDYSAFSVLCASVCDTRILFDIGSSAFWPQPRVTSSVVQIVPKDEPVPLDRRRDFFDFVRAAFSSRRKTLRNALYLWARAALPSLKEGEFETLLQKSLKQAGFGVDIRAEVLDSEELFLLYRTLMLAEE
ncbi:MAG: 16S rRNA (adenine(1518)-N(6)/adenine(1519)-N(6))-dimethyltransferase RsmA [Rectinema sp.]